MRWRPWVKVVGGIIAVIMVLLVVNSVISAQKERGPQIQGGAGQRNEDSFAPQELYQSASPGRGLLEALTPRAKHSARAMKTVGISLSEEVDKGSDRPSQVGSTPLKLIRTGQVSVEVPDFDKAAKELGKMVEGLGGYLADTQVQRHPSGARSGSITLRIPAASFESVGSKIRTLGKVLSESTNVQDVTRAYADLETRLRVKREALNRIRELLRTRAGNLKEVLEAEKEISRITEEIEQAEGERRYYEHQIALSTITVSLSEPEPISLARPSSWWALSEALRDSAAMVAGSLAYMLRLLLILLPWLALAWVGLVGIRWVRNRRNRPDAIRPDPLEPPSSSAGAIE